jgi:hypothetical protein
MKRRALKLLVFRGLRRRDPAENGPPHSLQQDCNELLTLMRTILNIGRSLAFFGAENKSMGGNTLMGKGVLLSAGVTEYSIRRSEISYKEV